MIKFILCLTIISFAFAISEWDPNLFPNSDNWTTEETSKGPFVAKCKPKLTVSKDDQNSVFFWSEFQGDDCPYLNINEKTTMSLSIKSSLSWSHLVDTKHKITYGNGKNEYYTLQFRTFNANTKTSDTTTQVTIYIDLTGAGFDNRIPPSVENGLRQLRMPLLQYKIEDKTYPTNPNTGFRDSVKGLYNYVSGAII